jgi:hypothetical protein
MTEANKPDIYDNSAWGDFENELWERGQAQKANEPANDPSPPLQPTKKARYVRTIPLEWAKKACQLPGKAPALILCLWYHSGLERKNTIKLTYKRLEEFNIDRQAARRLLPLLEGAGLVTVKRSDNQAPLVTIIGTPYKDEEE